MRDRVCNAPLRRRRAAAEQSRKLQCGCRDPWTCRHYESTTGLNTVDTYAAAARHLLSSGLTPALDLDAMRVLWRRSREGRALVEEITTYWEVTA